MEGLFCVVVFFYGGLWCEGDCKDYVFVGEVLVVIGVIVMVVDYWLYLEVCYFDFLLDCVVVMVFVWWWLDWQGYVGLCLFVVGYSVGVYNVVMVVIDGCWFEVQGLCIEMLLGWIGMVGFYNFFLI